MKKYKYLERDTLLYNKETKTYYKVVAFRGVGGPFNDPGYEIYEINFHIGDFVMFSSEHYLFLKDFKLGKEYYGEKCRKIRKAKFKFKVKFYNFLADLVK